MDNVLALDAKFIELATPVPSEFGFSGIKELVKEQLSMMLLSKIDHYEAESRQYESRYEKPFEDVSGQRKVAGAENFDLDDDLNDWRFAREATTLYRTKLQELQNA